MAIGVIAGLKVQPGKEGDFEAVFKTLAAEVRAKEPGNSLYQLCKSKAEAGSYVVMEIYADDAALKAHGTSDHFRAAGAGLAGCLAGPPQIQYFETV